MKKSSKPHSAMVFVRKWSRILHRDIGFFFVGTAIIYGISGIALNHLNDWNPNYKVQNKQFTSELDLKKENFTNAKLQTFLEKTGFKNEYKNHYFPDENNLKIFLKGNSSIILNTQTGKATAEIVKKRPVFFQTNFLHYNPNAWWMWFSDIFAAALILFSITGIFMVRGKKGAVGRGSIYIIAGIIIPILFLIFI